MTELLAMTCDACGEPMLPNVSTLDEHGCLLDLHQPALPGAARRGDRGRGPGGGRRAEGARRPSDAAHRALRRGARGAAADARAGASRSRVTARAPPRDGPARRGRGRRRLSPRRGPLRLATTATTSPRRRRPSSPSPWSPPSAPPSAAPSPTPPPACTTSTRSCRGSWRSATSSHFHDLAKRPPTGAIVILGRGHAGRSH